MGGARETALVSSTYAPFTWRLLTFTEWNWKCHVIIVIKTDLSGFVVPMHSGLGEQYVKSLGLTPSGFDFLFRTRPRAFGQQTPAESVLIPWIKHVITRCASSVNFIALKQILGLWQRASHMPGSPELYAWVYHVFIYIWYLFAHYMYNSNRNTIWKKRKKLHR